MTRILLTYGKHPFDEMLAYRMGKFLERYQNENLKIREWYISIPWKLDFWDFTGLPEAYLSKLIERPDLHIDLHQGVKKESIIRIDEQGNMVEVIKIPPTDSVELNFLTPESLLKEYLAKGKGCEVPYIRSKIEVFLVKCFDLIGPKYVCVEVMTPPSYEPTKIEIEELSRRLYKVLIQLPKDKKQLNHFVFEFNKKEDERVRKNIDQLVQRIR
jgi:hypothetical protein